VTTSNATVHLYHVEKLEKETAARKSAQRKNKKKSASVVATIPRPKGQAGERGGFVLIEGMQLNDNEALYHAIQVS
jgi:hypothetical protein